jgi:3-oxoacyl-[acyl-carrier protein] reductase
MEKDLAGKTAVVTGASRGLGVHMAIRLARAGALVAVNYASDEAAAGETVRRIEEQGGEAFAVQATLGGEAEAVKLAEACETEFTRRTGQGGVDILVNNHRGGVRPGNVEQCPRGVLPDQGFLPQDQ